MGLLEKLVLDRKQENIIDVLKKDDTPLFIWGSGNLAELVRKYLKRNGIEKFGVFEWPNIYNRTFYGDRVYSLDEIEKCYPKFNVVVGHSHYSKGKELLEHSLSINQMFFMFSFDYCGDNCNTFFDKNIIMKNISLYEDIYESLADQKSRINLTAFLNTKITGDVKYIFEVFDKETNIFKNNVYNIIEDECYWNIGGGKGETIAEFLCYTKNKFRQIVALEPDLNSYNCLNNYIEHLPFGCKIKNFQKAAWNIKEKIIFCNDDGVVQSGRVGTNNEGNGCFVDGIPLDRLLYENEEILSPTFITANYFNGLSEMLIGCKNILKKFGPKLALVVGHNDEYGIPNTIKTILEANSKYKLHLEFSQALATTLVLYAVLDEL